jgi:hypothetical protein
MLEKIDSFTPAPLKIIEQNPLNDLIKESPALQTQINLEGSER